MEEKMIITQRKPLVVIDGEMMTEQEQKDVQKAISDYLNNEYYVIVSSQKIDVYGSDIPTHLEF